MQKSNLSTVVLGSVEIRQVSFMSVLFCRKFKIFRKHSMIVEKRVGKDLERSDYLFFKAESPVPGLICSQKVTGTEVQ